MIDDRCARNERTCSNGRRLGQREWERSGSSRGRESRARDRRRQRETERGHVGRNAFGEWQQKRVQQRRQTVDVEGVHGVRVRVVEEADEVHVVARRDVDFDGTGGEKRAESV